MEVNKNTACNEEAQAAFIKIQIGKKRRGIEVSGINIMERIENETMDFEFSLFNKYSDLEK